MANRLHTRLALTAATVLLSAAPATAQRPLGLDQLPKSGSVTYEGTMTGNDFNQPITFTVDFSTGHVEASFKIPPETFEFGTTHGFGSGGAGDIDAEGGFLLVDPSTRPFVAQPGVSVASFIAGNFFNGGATSAAGVFLTQFCLDATAVPCPGVVGSYEATRVR